MQFTNYFFTSVFSFLGLLIGIILIRIAPEEQKPLQRHFALARRILMLLVFVFLFFYYLGNWFYMTALLGYLAFLLLAEYKIGDLLKKSIISYIVLGILFFLSSKNGNLIAIESSLILLYGIATASLMYSRKYKNHSRIIFYNIGFLITANLLFYI